MAIKRIAVSSAGDVLRLPDTRGMFRVPSEGTFWQSVQDIYSGEWFDRNGKPCPRSMTKWRNPPYMALPSTVQAWGALKIGEFFPLTREWQEFWRDLIDYATEFTLSREVLSVEKLTDRHLLYWYAYATQHSLALTDNHAALNDGKPIVGGFADYVLGINLGNSKPIAIKSLSMSGNIYKQMGFRSDSLICETLNAGKIANDGKTFLVAPPPKIADVWGKNWLIHWGVESTANIKLADGSYPQTSFPPRPFGLPFPFMGIEGQNLIRMNRIVPLMNGDFFSPYYPVLEEK